MKTVLSTFFFLAVLAPVSIYFISNTSLVNPPPSGAARYVELSTVSHDSIMEARTNAEIKKLVDEANKSFKVK